MEVDEQNRVIELDEDDAVLLASATPKVARLFAAVRGVLKDVGDVAYNNPSRRTVGEENLDELRAAYEALGLQAL